MILPCGIPSEPPLAMVAEPLAPLGSNHFVLDQRVWSTILLQAEVDGERCGAP